jgi:hypothetical protein
MHHRSVKRDEVVFAMSAWEPLRTAPGQSDWWRSIALRTGGAPIVDIIEHTHQENKY